MGYLNQFSEADFQNIFLSKSAGCEHFWATISEFRSYTIWISFTIPLIFN